MSTQAAIKPDNLQCLWRELGQTLRYFLDEVEGKSEPTEADINAIVALGVFKLEELRRCARIAAASSEVEDAAQPNGQAVNVEERLAELITAHLQQKDRIPIVAFVNALLSLAAEVGTLSCVRNGDSSLQFIVDRKRVYDLPVERALSILRACCARLAMVCHEQNGQEPGLYGAEAEFDYEYAPGKRLHYSVCTTNSPNHQGFLIETRPLKAPG